MKEFANRSIRREATIEGKDPLVTAHSRKDWDDVLPHKNKHRLRKRRTNVRVGRHRRSDAPTGALSPRTTRSMFLTHADIRGFFEIGGDINIDSFELLRVVGIGSSGIVTKALFVGKDLPNHPLPPFCIKSIDKAKINSSKQVEHLQRELSVLKMLANTPNCVQLYSVFQDRHCFHFVTDFIPGGDLFQRIYPSYSPKKKFSLSIDEVRFYFAELVATVQRLHSLDIVYRDLKPENVMIAASGHIKLVDFGFAKVLSEAENLTTSTICGTMEYISPEIAMALFNRKSEAVHGKAVDYWSLAVCLYELCTGSSIFGSYCNDMMELYTAVIQRKVRFPKTIDPQCKDLIKHCLRSDPASRLGNADRPMNHHDFLRYDQWGKSLDWEDVKSNRLDPPWIPHLKGPLDSQIIQSPSESEIRSFGKGPGGLVGFNLASEDLFACFGPILPNEPTFTRLIPD